MLFGDSISFEAHQQEHSLFFLVKFSIFDPAKMGDHPTHIQKKRTMMKDRVGCVRASTYSLPPEGHSYGMKTEQADEGVGTSKLKP